MNMHVKGIQRKPEWWKKEDCEFHDLLKGIHREVVLADSHQTVPARPVNVKALVRVADEAFPELSHEIPLEFFELDYPEKIHEESDDKHKGFMKEAIEKSKRKPCQFKRTIHLAKPKTRLPAARVNLIAADKIPDAKGSKKYQAKVMEGIDKEINEVYACLKTTFSESIGKRASASWLPLLETNSKNGDSIHERKKPLEANLYFPPIYYGANQNRSTSRQLFLESIRRTPIKRTLQDVRRIFHEARKLEGFDVLSNDALMDLAMHIHLVSCSPGESIPAFTHFHDSNTDGWFVIYEGKVQHKSKLKLAMLSLKSILSSPNAEKVVMMSQAPERVESFGPGDRIGSTTWTVDSGPQTESGKTWALTDCLLLQVQFKDHQRVLKFQDVRQYQDRYAFLKTHAVFENVDPMLVDQIARQSATVKFRPGECIVDFGNERNTVMFVRSGKITVDLQVATNRSDMDIQNWGILEEGMYFGEELSKRTSVQVHLPGKPSTMRVRAFEQETVMIIISDIPSIVKLKKELVPTHLYEDMTNIESLQRTLHQKREAKAWDRIKLSELNGLLKERTCDPNVNYKEFITQKH